eukprot:gene19260-22703_t
MIEAKNDSPWDRAHPLSKWTFHVANEMLMVGEKRPLQFDDLIEIPEVDRAKNADGRIESNGFPRNASVVFLLDALQNADSYKAYRWAGLIAALGVLQAIVHHILFFVTMRIGWNWRTSCTGLIYDALFKLEGADMHSVQNGKMVNMISNDVTRIEEFAVFICFTWEAFLEVALVLLILIYILNIPAAFAGVGTTFLFIPPMLYLAGQFAKLRGKTAAATDQRVRHISEIIDGIGQVKSYAWETPFFDMIGRLRKQEVKNITGSQTL